MNIKLDPKKLDEFLKKCKTSSGLPSSSSKCEITGKTYASEYAKNKSQEAILLKKRKQGLVPRYLYNPKTGTNKFLGFKSIHD